MTSNVVDITTSKRWTPPDLSDNDRSIKDLCREWHVIEARKNYDLTLVDLNDKAGDEVLEAARSRQQEIENELVRVGRGPRTVEDASRILDVFLATTEGHGADANDLEMVRAVAVGLAQMAFDNGRRAI